MVSFLDCLFLAHLPPAMPGPLSRKAGFDDLKQRLKALGKSVVKVRL